MNKAWKEHERRTAAAFGGHRAGATGKGGEDVTGVDWLTIECKERQHLPVWLNQAMSQAVGYAMKKLSETLPIVVIHEIGRRSENDLVVMRRQDFISWFGAIDE